MKLRPQWPESAFHRAHFKIKFNKTFELEAGSADLASLLLVYRAAELMPLATDLGEYLDRVLDLRIVLLSEVRSDATVQPAHAGL